MLYILLVILITQKRPQSEMPSNSYLMNARNTQNQPRDLIVMPSQYLNSQEITHRITTSHPLDIFIKLGTFGATSAYSPLHTFKKVSSVFRIVEGDVGMGFIHQCGFCQENELPSVRFILDFDHFLPSHSDSHAMQPESSR